MNMWSNENSGTYFNVKIKLKKKSSADRLQIFFEEFEIFASNKTTFDDFGNFLEKNSCRAQVFIFEMEKIFCFWFWN